MEWIKSILEKHVGEDGKLNLDEAIKDINKDAPKNVVPKEQYNTISTAKTQLEADLKDRDKQLETLSKSTGNAEELQKTIAELQEANKQAQKDYEVKLADLKYDAAIEKALANAVHPDLVQAKIDRTKLKLNEDGSITGLDEQVTGLKKTYADQWKPEKTGKTPANPEGGQLQTVTKEQFDKMGYLSKVKLKHDNPELYSSLKGEGGTE